MLSAPVSRRAFVLSLAGYTGTAVVRGQTAEEPTLGSLYPAVQGLADASPLRLSFLRPEYKNLAQWQSVARNKLFELLHYAPPPVAADPHIVSRRQRDGYREERFAFRTSPQFTVPGHLLIPDGPSQPRPGIILMHDHGGFYLWGREKVLANDDEHPSITSFKRQYYAGRSIGAELARRGYVVMVIDMLYWGERRLLPPSASMALRNRTSELTEREVNEYNSWAGRNEQLMARSLLTAGVTWPGIAIWDDIRTLDYLARRPEVDRERLGCIGLSVGGYRSFMLAALDTRIKATVDVCWMTMFGAQIRNHITNTMGESFLIPGMYRYLDLPDLAAAIAPRALLLFMGSQDGLFPAEAKRASMNRIAECYAKAKAPGQQSCRMFEAPHEFNLGMQEATWTWLESQLGKR